MADTRIIRCTCEHEYQDAKYGRWNRVHNKTESKDGPATEWRCTVCGKRTR